MKTCFRVLLLVLMLSACSGKNDKEKNEAPFCSKRLCRSTHYEAMGMLSLKLFLNMVVNKECYALRENICRQIGEEPIIFKDLDELAAFFNPEKPWLSKGNSIEGKLFHRKKQKFIQLESGKANFVITYIDDNFVVCKYTEAEVKIVIDLKSKVYMCLTRMLGGSGFTPENLHSIYFLKPDLMPVLKLSSRDEKVSKPHIEYFSYKRGKKVEGRTVLYASRSSFLDMSYKELISEGKSRIGKSQKVIARHSYNESFNEVPLWREYQ